MNRIEGRRARWIITAALRLMRLRGMSRLDPFSPVLPRLFPRGVKVRLSSGAVLRLPMDHQFWFKIVRRGYQELGTERLLIAGLRPGDKLIDVGAHRGIFTVIGAQRVGDGGHVYAFEPDPKNMHGLKKAIHINGVTNVTVEGRAVGEVDSPARFVQTRIGYERLAERPPGAGAWLTAPMVALETYVRENAIGSVRMLKVDVDGPELMVLQGGRQLLEAPEPPLIVMELSRLSEQWRGGYHEARAYLSPYGYELYGCERTRGHVVPLPSASELPWNLTTTTVTLIAVIPSLHRGVVDEGLAP
ncbi:MAG TPA: FkbM family methyltransferase, partial [Nitrospiraceae bacterium]|nr:FkbM family methyltransferase [Nitrospiraceae bacterium]